MLLVVERLLQECDRVVANLIESWEEERDVERKLHDTANPYFPSLVATTQRKAAYVQDDDAPDPREIDKVLSEVAGIAGRWALFKRFLADRLREDIEKTSTNTPEPAERRTFSVPTTPTASQKDLNLSEEPVEALPRPEIVLINSCKCITLISTLLSKYYIPLETWYLRSVIDKAHRLSTVTASSDPPQTTTTPDDVFYILKLVLTRLLSTGSNECVEKMIETVVKPIVERDFAGVVRRKMEEIYATGAAGQGRSGVTGAAGREKQERENRNAFIIYLNDLDISASHMDTLIKSTLSSPIIQQSFADDEVQPAQAEFSSLSSLILRFKSILKWGIEQLFNQLTRPKLRSLVSDVYKDVSYVLDEDGYSTAEFQDVVRKRFIKAWEALVDGFKATFTEGNYAMFFSLAVEILVRPWEKHILGMKFSELGAIRFDKDLRSISTYLSSQTAFGDAREKFQRLQQLSTILNLDLEEDPDEFYTSSGINWKLSQNEVRVAAALRVS
ncbi:hypothetical protein FRC02_005936 [Tulasnella sp. 418]|nr:hypothetical protein FRC02_005936 [Tulasnella sp. 418]